VTSQKRPYHVTFELDVDLEHILDAGSNDGDNRVQVWWRSSHVCGRSSDLRVKVYRQTDDGRLAIAYSSFQWNELKMKMVAVVAAAVSCQLITGNKLISYLCIQIFEREISEIS